MGELAIFMDRIRNDPRVGKIRFSSSFLEDVGNILDRRGFDEARLYIWGLRERRDLERQVLPLLLILGEMEKVRKIEEERAIGKYILKNKLGLLIE